MVAPVVSAVHSAAALLKALAIENVVAQDQCDRVVADEVAANDERLGKAFGLGLLGVREVQAPLRSIAQQSLKPGRSWGVEINRISRIPASINVDSG